jgi:hypothetical protein
MSFYFPLQNQRTGGQNRSCLGGVGTSGSREEVGRVNICKYCVHIHVNGKMISVETVPGMRGGGIKENGGGGEFKCDIFDIFQDLL